MVRVGQCQRDKGCSVRARLKKMLLVVVTVELPANIMHNF